MPAYLPQRCIAGDEPAASPKLAAFTEFLDFSILDSRSS
jgi:hypothetical protein